MKNIRTILLLITLIIFGNIKAAIIYTDITDGQPAGIDFNQDGTWEFEIMDNMGIGDGLNYWANANNNIYAIDAANWDVPEDLLLNATIDSGGNWEGFGDAAVVGWGGPVAFAIDVDRYLGMKLELNGNIYYGWVRVEVNQNGLDAWGDPAYEVTYKDYAYNDVADAAILAGEMPAAGNIDVTGITVTGQGGSTTLGEGSTLQMLAAILPANATDQTVTWSVTNGTGTATISGTGLLSGLTQGTVTVIATANDGSGIVGQLVITITGPIDVTGITVSGQGGATSVEEASTLQMLAAILPANATDQTVTWSVTNGTGTATISTSGLLSGLTQGTVTVTATTNDGSGIVGQLVVTITGPTDVTGITVTGQGGATTLGEGSTLQMLAAILPANATDQTVTWSVINGTGTATISTSGLLSGLTQGSVTVVATANDGSGIIGDMQVTITVPQNILIQNLTILTPNGQDVITDINGTLQMIVTIYPGNATNQTVTWEVINQTGSATISGTGLLTAVSNGTVLVRVTANDGSGLSAEKEITINMDEVVNGLNDTQTIQLEVYPNPFTDQININAPIESNVSIFDMTRKVVTQFNMQESSEMVNMSDFNSGVYIIRVESENNSAFQKVVKK